MVKIFKGLYISPLTVAFFIVCYLSGKEAFFVISYLSMIIHELAHLGTAYFIGLKPSRISLHPFGVNLRLKTNLVCSVSDKIILYLSGPLMNLIIAFLFITVYKGRYLYDYGFAVNIMLFFVNMLPICPLDGGNIAKKVLAVVAGEDLSVRVMKLISFILSMILLPLGIYIIRATGYNYSCVFISALMLANVFTSKEKYSQTAIKNLIWEDEIYKDKTGKPVQMFVSQGQPVCANYLKHIRPGVFTCVLVADDNGEITKIVSEKELMKL